MIKDILQHNDNIEPNYKELAVLKEHFPGCFTVDGSFDVERFKSEIASATNVVQEGYELKFLGKSYAKLLASTDTTTVIQPNEAHNSLPENVSSENIYISGDNLDGLKHLLKSYNGAIKCIYIDPPYNTGSDGFVYADNFNYTKETLQEKLSVSEEEAERILDLTKRGSASHSAWLMFMYSRLLLARDLLTDDGVIFISIDDNEQANLKLLCDDAFGEEFFVSTFPWKKRTAKSDVPFGISQDYEWIICFTRKYYGAGIGVQRKYYYTDDYPNDGWRLSDLTKQTSADERENSAFDMIDPKTDNVYPYNPNRVWSVTKDTFPDYYKKGKIVFPGDYDFLNISIPAYRVFESEDKAKALKKFGSEDAKKAVSTFLPKEVGMSEDGNKEILDLFDKKVFSYPKPSSLIQHFLKASSETDFTALDFFSGSATTAHAVMKLNANDGGKRKFIAVQLPEVLSPDIDSQKIAYEFLQGNNLPTTLDYIGIERIKRAAAKTKRKRLDEQNEKAGELFNRESPEELDLGFKHYLLIEPNQNTLDKLYSFDKAAMLADTSILDDFGKPTILATWLNADGYGLTTKAEAIDLAGYTAYYYQKHLYLIDSGFTLESMKALLSKYDAEGHFNPENLVLFGYSFPDWSINEMIEKNLRILNDGEKNLKINFAVRY
ncbi:MAG: site-specific DNA-methyltransferase [Chitinophagaceae bacterium]|nr:site-specific DNA-methyltransferase [Chitinophagaceae bacterium]